MDKQIYLKLNPLRNKKISKGRADFHRLGLLLKLQLEEENKRKIKYKYTH